MHGNIDCERCVYATRVSSSSKCTCNNKFALETEKHLDKYDCPFFDEVSDSYIFDMYRVMEHT